VPLTIPTGFDPHRIAILGVGELQCLSLKQELGNLELFSEIGIVLPVAMDRISDNGMTHAREVAADLVEPSGLGVGRR